MLIPRHGFLKVGGELTCHRPDGPATTSATFACQHCGKQIKVFAGEDLADKMGRCHIHSDDRDPLSGLICAECVDDLRKTGKCFPWQRMMQDSSDREIQMARLRAGVTKY